MRGLRVTLLGFLMATSPLACAPATSSGDFEGLSFAPTQLAFAVHDRHTFLDNNGQPLAVRRPTAELAVDFYFADVDAVPDIDWRHLSAEEQRDLRRGLAEGDAFYLRHVPLFDIDPGASLEWTLQDPVTDGDVAFAAAHGQADLQPDGLGVGALLELKLDVDDADIGPSQGFVRGTFEFKRSRAESQEGDVATGVVEVDFQIPVVAERVGKANAALFAPIVRCAAAHGPAQQSGCADVDTDPVVDESSSL